MCLIAHRPLGKRGRGAHIPNEVIDIALGRHPDGFGIAWRNDGKLLWERYGPEDKTKFRAKLKEIDADRRVEYAAHFRLATHGPEVRELAHPFSYKDPKEGHVLVFHNGVIGIKTGAHESDTQVFVRDVLSRLPSRWWANPALRYLVDEAIGYSKLLLMTARETVNLHHDRGDEDGGLWYSSNHKPYTWSGSKTVTSLAGDDDDDWVNYRSWRSGTPTKGASGTIYAPATEPENTYPRSNSAVWVNAGHILAPTTTFDFTKDGTYESAIVCGECQTMGDVYLIDGKAYVDIVHVSDVLSADKEEAEACEVKSNVIMLPATSSTASTM